MRIFEFIDKYCRDLVESAKKERDLIDLGQFPHDDVIMDESGAYVPIVLVDGQQIPVADFLTMSKEDFVAAWKTPNSGSCYDNYIDALGVLEGEEAVHRLRIAMQKAASELKNDAELYLI